MLFLPNHHIHPKAKLAWMVKTFFHLCSDIAKDVSRFYEPVAMTVRAVVNKMPGKPVKGTMFTKEQTQSMDVGHLAMSAQMPSTSAVCIDVTQAARQLQFGLPVKLEAEAFGVCVTRRHGAAESNLIPHESIRLLDLLVAAKDFLGECDAEAKQFPLWVIPSDARDNRPRGLWLEMSKADNTYLIGLTDQ